MFLLKGRGFSPRRPCQCWDHGLWCDNSQVRSFVERWNTLNFASSFILISFLKKNHLALQAKMEGRPFWWRGPHHLFLPPIQEQVSQWVLKSATNFVAQSWSSSYKVLQVRSPSYMYWRQGFPNIKELSMSIYGLRRVVIPQALAS